MKRFFLLLLIWLVVQNIEAQLTVSNTTSYVFINNKGLYGVDAIVLFNGITSSSTIQYTGTGTTEWRLYDGSFYSNQTSITPDDATGYVLLVNNVPFYYVWVVDYTRYIASFQSLEVVESSDECSTLMLQLESQIPNINYRDSLNNARILPRDFSVSYETSEFSSDTWVDKTENVTLRAPISLFSVDAPKSNTAFSLTGDQWATQLGIEPDTIYSNEYIAVSLECHPVGTIVERDGLNEKDRSSTTVSGSGPLVVDFMSQVNPLSQVFFEWTVWDVQYPLNYMRYSDMDFRYTFNKSGEYWVKLYANSTKCECVDSIKVTVRESLLEVPNAFSPNNDGINDEFRVAYRSLASFRMTIFNRWGRIIFDSSNPAKGWNGRINGKDAAAGTYYYLIEAQGTDKNSKGKPIKYKRSGAVNLFR